MLVTVNFLSHNIVLPDGSQTAPERMLVSESGVCRAALRYLAEEFGPGPHPDVTVADVGCMEGGYAAEFARAGYDVTGIEIRAENYERARQLPSVLALDNLRFIQGDAREVLRDMSFDAVFCCGLLYHMDRPVAFLNLLGLVTRRMLILNTHFSMEGGHPEEVHHPGEWCDMSQSQNEGRTGHWSHEADTIWSSHEAHDSFWLARDDLMEAIADAGFTLVRERTDWLVGESPEQMPHGSGGAYPDRGMFTGIKP